MSTAHTARNLVHIERDLRELADAAAQLGNLKLAWDLDNAANWLATAQTDIVRSRAERPLGLRAPLALAAPDEAAAVSPVAVASPRP